MNRQWQHAWVILPLILMLVSCTSAFKQPLVLQKLAFTEPLLSDTQRPTNRNEMTAATLPPTAMLALIDTLHDGAAEHADQAAFVTMVQTGQGAQAFAEAFHHGDELFETQFNALDGVGANVGQGLRFTQIPRADLNSAGEWAKHFPKRITGPNAEACNQCHGSPVDDGAGRAINNNVRDPGHTGLASQFIVYTTCLCRRRDPGAGRRADRGVAGPTGNSDGKCLSYQCASHRGTDQPNDRFWATHGYTTKHITLSRCR